jgi:hypothetical protein
MEHTRFVGLDIHKERISIAVAESGRSGAVEYLGEISNDPVAIGKLCDRLERRWATRWHFATRPARAAMAFIVNSPASAIAAMWWRRH